MAHMDWCGKPCCECKHRCELDESIPCSPDCENLSIYGEFTHKCADCDVYKMWVNMCYKVFNTTLLPLDRISRREK